MISKPWTPGIIHATSPRFLIPPIHYHILLSVYRLAMYALNAYSHSAFVPHMIQAGLPGLLVSVPERAPCSL